MLFLCIYCTADIPYNLKVITKWFANHVSWILRHFFIYVHGKENVYNVHLEEKEWDTCKGMTVKAAPYKVEQHLGLSTLLNLICDVFSQ